jgi:hypothetical protein
VGRRWCRTDPAVKIDGEVGKLTFFASTEDDRFATGPINLVLVGVKNVSISQSNVFGQKINVSADEDGIDELEGYFYIPGPDGIEIRAVLEPAGVHDVPVLFAYGVTNEQIWFM